MKPLDAKPTSLEAELIRDLWWGNLIAFGVVTAAAAIFTSWHQALSVVVGGLIALVNFRLLARSISRALRPPLPRGLLSKTLIKYYARFGATCLVIFLLIRQEVVNPLGLLVGLSVVMISIFVWGARQVHKLSKEAF